MKDVAGPTREVTCGGCDKKITVYERSFFGVGKKCPHCGMVNTPNIEDGVWKP